MTIQQIELASITADQSAQPRTEINVARVSEYTDDMDRGDTFPPLVVFSDGRRNWLADGFHRFYAAVNAGRKVADCDVRPGTLRDAVLHSCGANAAHGMRRTNEDKRLAVTRLLEDAEWGKWSNVEIGRSCSVGDDLVRAVRKELAAHTSGNGSMEPDHTRGNASMERTFIHPKTGQPSTMDTSKIGWRAPSIAELPPDGPLIAKGLREIERWIDMMPPAPGDAVVHLPSDQFYNIPISKLESMGIWMTGFAQAMRSRIVEQAHG